VERKKARVFAETRLVLRGTGPWRIELLDIIRFESSHGRDPNNYGADSTPGGTGSY